MKFSNLKIGTRLFAAFGIMSVLLILMGIIGYRSLRVTEAAADTIMNHEVPLSDISMEARLALTDQHAAAAGYLLTNRTSELDSYRRTFDEASRSYEEFAKAILEGGKIGDLRVEPTDSSEVRTALEAADEQHQQFAAAAQTLFDLHRRKLQGASVSESQLAEHTAELETTLKAAEESLRKAEDASAKEMTAAMQRVDSAHRSSVILLVTIAAVALAMAMIVSVAVTRGIVVPLREVLKGAQAIAANDLTVDVDSAAQDEIGVVTRTFGEMVVSLRAMVTRIREVAGQLTQSSNLVATAAGDAGKASQQIAETIQQVAKGASDQTSTVTTTAKSMEQLNQAIEEVAKGSQAQALSAQDTSRQMNEISHTVELVARNTQSSAQAAQQVAQTAKTGGDAVQNSVKGMIKINESTSQSSENIRSLGDSSKQIGEIVDMITDIAEQTNLLALNAAIEAARAGEHGKGFAVVADEVRKLAERSANATKEIGGLIKSIQAGVETAVSSMEQVAREVEQGTLIAQHAGKALDGIMAGVDGIVGRVQDVSAAAQQMAASAVEVVKAVENISAITEQSTASTQQMSANSGEVTRAVEQISAISQQNAAAAEEVSAAAEEQNASVEEMSASAQEMAKLASDLEQLVAQFKLENGHAGRQTQAAGAPRRTERARVPAAV